MKTQLNLSQNLEDFDEFYDMLSDSLQDLNRDQADMLNSQLVLLMANHIGDMAVLRQAFAMARVKVEMVHPN
jgi:hypothetical protein